MAGFAFGALAILRLGDIFGRKPILIISTASSIIVYFILCFVKDTKIIYVLLFIDGAMRLTKGSLAYIVTLELIPKNKRSKFSSIITSVGGCTSLFTVGLIYIFKDALITLSILTVISLVQFLFVLICPESPKFLYSINKIKEVNQSLKFIAKVNCSDHQEVTLDEDDTNSKSKDSNNLLSFFEALKNRTYRINILIMSFIYCVTFMCYYAIGFYVGNFPGNLFINAFALMVSDIVGSGLCTLWINTFGFKHGFSVMYIIVVISTVMYYLFGGTIFISYACVFMMRFGLTMAVSLSLFACSQIFETKIQARSFAFCNFLGKLTSILGPLIVTLAPNPLLPYCTKKIHQKLNSKSIKKLQFLLNWVFLFS